MLRRNPTILDGLDLGDLFAGIDGLQRIGLAVSGGPDSLALMVMMRAWCDLRGAPAPEVYVYSVDHGLRPEAAGEAEFVVRSARDFGFSGRVLVWQGDKPATGVQAAARAARYGLVGAAMAKDNVPVLLTAHHADDQAETMLMRMAHGSGLTGLGGMAAWAQVEQVRVYRPLLGLRRDVLQKIVTHSGLKPVQDPSNSDPHYERVRWRQAAPALAEQGLTANGLARLGLRMQRAEAALAQTANAAFTAHVTRDWFGVAHLSRADFAPLDDEIALRVLAHMFTAVGREIPRLEQLETLLAGVGQAGFSGTCLSGAQVQHSNGALVVFAEAGRMDAAPAQIAPGASLVWDQRFAINNAGKEALTVTHSVGLTRVKAEQFSGTPITIPMAAVAAAPSVFEADGTQVALGLFTRSQQVAITLSG